MPPLRRSATEAPTSHSIAMEPPMPTSLRRAPVVTYGRRSTMLGRHNDQLMPSILSENTIQVRDNRKGKENANDASKTRSTTRVPLAFVDSNVPFGSRGSKSSTSGIKKGNTTSTSLRRNADISPTETKRSGVGKQRVTKGKRSRIHHSLLDDDDDDEDDSLFADLRDVKLVRRPRRRVGAKKTALDTTNANEIKTETTGTKRSSTRGVTSYTIPEFLSAQSPRRNILGRENTIEPASSLSHSIDIAPTTNEKSRTSSSKHDTSSFSLPTLTSSGGGSSMVQQPQNEQQQHLVLENTGLHQSSANFGNTSVSAQDVFSRDIVSELTDFQGEDVGKYVDTGMVAPLDLDISPIKKKTSSRHDTEFEDTGSDIDGDDYSLDDVILHE